MKILACFILLAVCATGSSQTKTDYLLQHRYDLTASSFEFPKTAFNIIGLGAYHGSAKLEDVELELIESLTQSGGLSFYIPETDFGIAYYLNDYLISGDTLLLRDLVVNYGQRVPQERTIEVYEKWKRLHEINQRLPFEKKLHVVGIDFMVNYKYASRYLVQLILQQAEVPPALKVVQEMVKTDTTSFALGDRSYAYQVLSDMVKEYEANPSNYHAIIDNEAILTHLIHNFKLSFDLSNVNRDAIMFDNYMRLDALYDFQHHAQFVRMGFFHVEKAREGENAAPSFFAKLIEEKIYPRERVVSIIGFYTDSYVVWQENYDEMGNYTGYSIEGGFGIGDYEKEYFRGISNLKSAVLSDQTLFQLNSEESPYSMPEPDLIEIILEGEPSNGADVKGMSTLDFMDFAVLISHSPSSKPIFELSW